MPLYEYKCPDGHVFEVFHGINEPSPEVCPVCGKGPLARVLHPVAVHFKGSGFYSTDYGRGGRKAARDGDKPSEKTESAPGDSKAPEKKAAEAS
ncbi:MAG TPA: zinc ribbon domain-containing protein [Gaiellaceae bacterium]|jgi:putative FmdB family regulatory protein|nr:zinc ribbon domain-containing protein [Gaiellaceae bacterium]